MKDFRNHNQTLTFQHLLCPKIHSNPKLNNPTHIQLRNHLNLILQSPIPSQNVQISGYTKTLTFQEPKIQRTKSKRGRSCLRSSKVRRRWHSTIFPTVAAGNPSEIGHYNGWPEQRSKEEEKWGKRSWKEETTWVTKERTKLTSLSPPASVSRRKTEDLRRKI